MLFDIDKLHPDEVVIRNTEIDELLSYQRNRESICVNDRCDEDMPHPKLLTASLLSFDFLNREGFRQDNKYHPYTPWELGVLHDVSDDSLRCVILFSYTKRRILDDICARKQLLTDRTVHLITNHMDIYLNCYDYCNRNKFNQGNHEPMIDAILCFIANRLNEYYLVKSRLDAHQFDNFVSVVYNHSAYHFDCKNINSRHTLRFRQIITDTIYSNDEISSK